MGGRADAGAEIRRQADEARRDMASMERSDAMQAGCLAASALLTAAAVAIYFAQQALGCSPLGHHASTPWLSIGVLAFVLLAAVYIFGLVRRAVYKKDTARNKLLISQFTEHFRSVLYDQGLLALVLGDDPRFSVPGIAERLGLQPAQGQRGTTMAVSSFSQRLELLLNYYGLLCKHYRIEPYPKDNPFAARGVDPIRLRGLPRRAMIFALEAGLDGSEIDEQQR